MKVNTPSGWRDATPKKVNTPAGWKDVVSVKVNTPSGWKLVWPVEGPVEEEPLWLYDVDITYKGSLVVDFALKKGLTGLDPLDEGFMFRCAQFKSLDGYVPRNFTKTFPASAYPALDCTVEDLYGDGTANPDYLYKKISFQVTPKA